MRSLADLTAIVDSPGALHFRINRGLRWEICSACRVACNPEALNCGLRRFRNERTRQNYLNNPKQRERGRIANLTPEQRQKRIDCGRRYYAECGDIVRIKQAERDSA